MKMKHNQYLQVFLQTQDPSGIHPWAWIEGEHRYQSTKSTVYTIAKQIQISQTDKDQEFYQNKSQSINGSIQNCEMTSHTVKN